MILTNGPFISRQRHFINPLSSVETRRSAATRIIKGPLAIAPNPSVPCEFSKSEALLRRPSFGRSNYSGSPGQSVVFFFRRYSAFHPTLIMRNHAITTMPNGHSATICLIINFLQKCWHLRWRSRSVYFPHCAADRFCAGDAGSKKIKPGHQRYPGQNANFDC